VSPTRARRLLAPFHDHPESSGLFTDFDGTLSAIVDEPSAARPAEGVVDVLHELATKLAVVAVVSGRPLSFLASSLDDPLLRLSGLYGLESSHGGERNDHPSAGAWREVIDDVAAQSAAAGPAGMSVENKGLSITLHYRAHPELAGDVAAWAERQARRSGLIPHPAKMSMELHPPIHAGKDTAVLALAEGLSAVCFVGDDRGDLAAFHALDSLAGKGVTTVRVVVSSDEAPPELLDRADLVVDGPAAAVGLLRSLL